MEFDIYLLEADIILQNEYIDICYEEINKILEKAFKEIDGISKGLNEKEEASASNSRGQSVLRGLHFETTKNGCVAGGAV